MKTRDFQNKIGYYSPFHDLKLGQGAMIAQMDHEYGDKAISLALSLGQGEDVESMAINNSRSGEKRVFPRHSNHVDASSGPLVLSKRHLPNDNFACLEQGPCKYQKFSTFLFHEKNKNDKLGLEQTHTSKKKNFVPFFLREQSENVRGQDSIDPRKLCYGWQAGDKVSCSVRNIETMRICTMVDSVENTLGGPPKISQRSRHFLFTKETCVNMSEDHQELTRPLVFSSHPPRGVKIQPLWTSTDSEEKENTGDPSICKSGNESSDETEAVEVEALENQRIVLDKELCPSNKDDAVNENAPLPGLDSNLEKARCKILTDGTELSTSRLHSLDAKQLFPCAESRKDYPLGLDANNRWIKRLKSSPFSSGVGTKSSEFGDASSNEKFSQLLNRIMKSNKAGLDNMVSKHQGNSVSSSLIGSKRKNQNMGLDSSWIQRWCPDLVRNPEPLGICEPHSLKLSQHEFSKKQFPSIAAMALMGKAMNGFRPREFRKRGPIVVWKTDEY